jgi:hypothetical protein
MQNNRSPLVILSMLLLAVPLTSGCSGDDDDGSADTPDAAVNAPDADPTGDGAAGEDLDMQAADFECVLHWDKVRAFRITNKLGHLDAALAVANNVNGGGDYPVGTIIQIVPQEAMVKRRAGWNPPSGDWEFFALGVSASGTTIDGRGTETTNAAGSCRGCHSKAMAQFDFVCEMDHGCDPLGISTDFLVQLQNNDARCP